MAMALIIILLSVALWAQSLTLSHSFGILASKKHGSVFASFIFASFYKIERC